MERIGHTASEEMFFEIVDGQTDGSEEMSFENVDGRTNGGRTPDACIYYKLTYEPMAQVS